jgi:gamma-glutamylcysteine synthetase
VALGDRADAPAHHTDYSESQLELITGVMPTPRVRAELTQIHQFVYQ